MKLAILADIHGNALALRAVLRDMEALGLTRAVNLGDHLSGPLAASETAELLRARNFPSIRGNHDRYLLEQDPAQMGASDRAAYAQLDRAQLDWLAQLPPTLTLERGEIFLCHGTPQDNSRYWLEQLDENGTPRAATLDEITPHAAGITAGLILCAHSHIPRLVRLADGRVIVNPGSVGCPAYRDAEPRPHVMATGAPHASYAIATRTPEGWSASFRRVPYPWQQASAQAAQQGREDWAEALATGWLSR